MSIIAFWCSATKEGLKKLDSNLNWYWKPYENPFQTQKRAFFGLLQQGQYSILHSGLVLLMNMNNTEYVPWRNNKALHNGGNDSYIRQLQLWDQIICQTKTANIFLWNWLVILMSCNSLTNFEYEEAYAKPEWMKFESLS